MFIQLPPGLARRQLVHAHDRLHQPRRLQRRGDAQHAQVVQSLLKIVFVSELMGSLKLGNVWGFVQLIHRSQNQLSKTQTFPNLRLLTTSEYHGVVRD